MDIAYTGEWTWAASLGRLLLALAFAGGIASTIGYTKAVRHNEDHWLKLGRWGFRTQAAGTLRGHCIDAVPDFLPQV